MKTLITQITDCIERTFDVGGVDYSRKIILFPCGDVGIQAANILRMIYAIEPAYLIDNRKCKYSANIHEFSFLNEIDSQEYVLFLTSTNPDIYLSLKELYYLFFRKKGLSNWNVWLKVLSKIRCLFFIRK